MDKNKHFREYKYPKYRSYFIEKAEKWREKNYGKVLNINKEYRRRVKYEVMSHYCGGEPNCQCCGEKIFEFLTIDHINGLNGKKRESKGASMCLYLRRNNYPKGFQVLCYNCNMGKRYTNICPHKLLSERSLKTFDKFHSEIPKRVSLEPDDVPTPKYIDTYKERIKLSPEMEEMLNHPEVKAQERAEKVYGGLCKHGSAKGLCKFGCD